MSEDIDTVTLATALTVAWLSNTNTRTSIDEVPVFLTSMLQALGKLGKASAETAAKPASAKYVPAVSVRKSLASPDHIISLIDGRPYRTLTRHLGVHGLTPAQYRERYGLKPDYPMIAPAYSEARRAMAKRIGLGRKPTQPTQQASEARPEPKAKPATRKRLGIAKSKTADTSKKKEG